MNSSKFRFSKPSVFETGSICISHVHKVSFKKKFEGAVNDDLAFQYGSNTDVYFGCGVALNGEFWYLGGGKESSKKRQVFFLISKKDKIQF